MSKQKMMIAKEEDQFETLVYGFSLCAYLDIWYSNISGFMTAEIGTIYLNNEQATVSFDVEKSLPHFIKEMFEREALRWASERPVSNNAEWDEYYDEDQQADLLA